MKREELGNVKRVRLMIFLNMIQKNVMMAELMVSGQNISIRVEIYGKSVTEQQQIWRFALAVAVLATTTTMAKKSIVVVILKQSLLMSC